VIERLVGWLKEHRRVATRFEKLSSSYMAMVKLSFVWRYLRVLEQSSGVRDSMPASPMAQSSL
jgi:hypothetical protein